MNAETKDHLWANLDKFLLVFMVLTFAALGSYGYRFKFIDLAAFAVDTSKLFAGALLTLITGKLLSRSTDKNGNGGNNNATTTPAPDPAGSDPAAGRVQPN